MALHESYLTGCVLKHRIVVFGLKVALMNSGLDSPQNILHNPVAAGTFWAVTQTPFSLTCERFV